MIVDKIQKYLTPNEDKDVNSTWLDECVEEIKASLLKQLFTKKENRPTLRLSGIGKCLRQQAYTIHNYPKKDLTPRNKLVFLMGDIIEAVVVLLAKHSGVELIDEQKEVEFDNIKGHKDGSVLDKDKKYTFECKSMASAGFDFFKRDGMTDDWGYVSQSNSYAAADGDDGIVWVGMNKNTCNLHEEIKDVDHKLTKTTKENIQRLKDCTSPDEFDRKDPILETWYSKPTGNIILPPVCSYCDYNETCWAGKVTKYLRGGKIKHYVGKIKHGKWTAGGEVIKED